MENNKTNTKTRNTLLAIVGVPLAITMASEVENPDYWWVPVVAAAAVFIIIKVALGGKDDWN
jgi:hypothetical protein